MNETSINHEWIVSVVNSLAEVGIIVEETKEDAIAHLESEYSTSFVEVWEEDLVFEILDELPLDFVKNSSYSYPSETESTVEEEVIYMDDLFVTEVWENVLFLTPEGEGIQKQTVKDVVKSLLEDTQVKDKAG